MDTLKTSHAFHCPQKGPIEYSKYVVWELDDGGERRLIKFIVGLILWRLIVFFFSFSSKLMKLIRYPFGFPDFPGCGSYGKLSSLCTTIKY